MKGKETKNIFENSDSKNYKPFSPEPSSQVKSEKKNVKDLFQNLSEKPNIFSGNNKSSIFQTNTDSKGIFGASTTPGGGLFGKDSEKKSTIFGGAIPGGSLFKKQDTEIV